jgi:hypothetical protein
MYLYDIDARVIPPIAPQMPDSGDEAGVHRQDERNRHPTQAIERVDVGERGRCVRGHGNL